jgi:hypothetical protein
MVSILHVSPLSVVVKVVASTLSTARVFWKDMSAAASLIVVFVYSIIHIEQQPRLLYGK